MALDPITAFNTWRATADLRKLAYKAAAVIAVFVAGFFTGADWKEDRLAVKSVKAVVKTAKKAEAKTQKAQKVAIATDRAIEEKRAAVDEQLGKVNDAIEANPATDECVLSADEQLQFDKLIDAANGD